MGHDMKLHWNKFKQMALFHPYLFHTRHFFQMKKTEELEVDKLMLTHSFQSSKSKIFHMGQFLYKPQNICTKEQLNNKYLCLILVILPSGPDDYRSLYQCANANSSVFPIWEKG